MKMLGYVSTFQHTGKRPTRVTYIYCKDCTYTYIIRNKLRKMNIG